GHRRSAGSELRRGRAYAARGDAAGESALGRPTGRHRGADPCSDRRASVTVPARMPVKFLVVDDLEENLLVLESLLRREGLEILKAGSGREALELLLEHDIALALIDVQMPE